MTADSIKYREATHADLPGMASLRAEQWGAGTEAHWEKRIARYLSGEVNPQQALTPRVIYVAVKEDTIAGFIAGHLTRRFGCDGELEWINVASECRGSGIASQLLQHLAVWFVSQKALYICVDCAHDNSAAQNFYKRHGAENLNKHWLIWKDISVTPGTGTGGKLQPNP